MVIAERMRESAPGDIDAARTLALARRRRADVLALTGAKAEALVDLEKSSQLYLGLADAAQASLDDKLEAGIAHLKLGDLLGNPNFENLGRAEDARGGIRPRRWRRSGGCRPRRPTTGGCAASWASRSSVRERCTNRRATGHAAEQAYQESYEVRHALADARPSHRDVVRDLGVALEKLGNVRRARSGAAAAVPSYREALAVFERLARVDPSDANAARTVAISREKLGDAVREVGERAEAISDAGVRPGHASRPGVDGRRQRARTLRPLRG